MKHTFFKATMKAMIVAIATGASAFADDPAPALDPSIPPPEVVTLLSQGFDPEKLAPCAVLDDFGGRVQVMSPARDKLLDTDVRAGVPCGGWVTVDEGWARLIHRDGYQITIGNHSFIEIFSSNGKGESRSLASAVGAAEPVEGPRDQIILYKGQIKLHAGAGAAKGEIRVLSPHARVRLNRGRAIVLFNKEANETQLITLEQTASLENRFEPDKRVKVKEGEASSLNFRAMRVVPSIPQAISIAALHQKMGELRIDERTQTDAITAARTRQNRKFATDLKRGNGKADRRPAGMVFEKEKYMKHPPRPEDEQVKRQWTKRLVGGATDGEAILNPDEFYGQGRKVSVTVYDPAEGGKAQESRAMRQEKARLLKELGRIQAD